MPEFDAAIVLSKNWANAREVVENGARPKLRVDSRLVALAGGLFYDFGRAGNLIICGGKTLGPEYPAESEEMARYIERRGIEIPHKHLFLDRMSFDTHDNAEKAKKVVEGNKFKRLALIATEPHMLRAEMVFRYHGFEFEAFYAEQLIAAQAPRYVSFIIDYRKSGHYQCDKRKEIILTLIQAANPSGFLLRSISSRLPSRKH